MVLYNPLTQQVSARGTKDDSHEQPDVVGHNSQHEGVTHKELHHEEYSLDYVMFGAHRESANWR